MMNIKILTLLCGSALTVTACAGGGAAYQPIIDGPLKASYSQDISECRRTAEQRGYVNSETKTGALLGAGVLGLSALDDAGGDAEFGDFLGGALIGGLLGGGATALETRSERKDILRNCMAGRGHKVVG